MIKVLWYWDGRYGREVGIIFVKYYVNVVYVVKFYNRLGIGVFYFLFYDELFL